MCVYRISLQACVSMLCSVGAWCVDAVRCGYVCLCSALTVVWVCVYAVRCGCSCLLCLVGACLCCALWVYVYAVLCGSTCCALCACVYAVLCVWGAYAVLCGATCCALWVRVSELCSVGVGAYAVLSLCVCLHCALWERRVTHMPCFMGGCAHAVAAPRPCRGAGARDIVGVGQATAVPKAGVALHTSGSPREWPSK